MDYDWNAYKDERYDIEKNFRDYDFFVEEETESTPYRIYRKPYNGDNDGCEVLNVDKFGEFYWEPLFGAPNGEQTYDYLFTLTDKIPPTVFFIVSRRGIIQDEFIASLTYYNRYDYDIDGNQILPCRNNIIELQPALEANPDKHSQGLGGSHLLNAGWR